MSGWFEVHRERLIVFSKHDHVVFHMSNGATIVFNDPRRFGSMWLHEDPAQDSRISALGPEPFEAAFGEKELAAAFHCRRAPLKAALSDQRIVAGLGNIYVSEALHRAGIDPRRAAGRIGAARIHALEGHIRDVLEEAIAAGGSSLRDHRQASGELGYFQHSFRVYDREWQPCPRPGCPGIIRRVVQGGRSSFFCPTCQR